MTPFRRGGLAAAFVLALGLGGAGLLRVINASSPIVLSLPLTSDLTPAAGTAPIFARQGLATCEMGDGGMTLFDAGVPCVSAGGFWARNLVGISSIASPLTMNSGVWFNVGSPTVTADVATCPDGILVGERIAYPATTSGGSRQVRYQQQALPDTTGQTWSGSAWVRSADAGTSTVYLSFMGTNSTFYGRQACPLSGAWSRCALDGVTIGTTGYYWFLGVDRNDAQQAGQPAMEVDVCYPTNHRNSTSQYTCKQGMSTADTQACKAEELFVNTAGWPTTDGLISLSFTPSAAFTTTPTHVLLDAMGDALPGLDLAIVSGELRFRTTDGTTTSSATSSGLTWTAGTTYAITATWGGGDLAITRNGDSVATASSATMPTGFRFRAYIGSEAGSVSNYARGKISNLVVSNPNGAATFEIEGALPAGYRYLFDAADVNGSSNEGLSSGDAISTWVGGGTGGNGAVTNSIYAPMFRTDVWNEQPVVSFDGVKDQMRFALDAGADFVHTTGVFDAVLVMRPTALTVNNNTTRLLLGSTNTGTEHGFAWDILSDAVRFRVFDGSGAAVGTATTTPLLETGRWFSLEASGDGGTLSVSRDMEEPYTGALSAVSSTTGTNVPVLGAVGAYPVGVTNLLSGDVAFVVIYDRQLTITERRQLQAYLFERYGDF